MSQISTAITIIDNFTPALQSLNDSLNIVTRSMMHAQSQLGKPIDLDAVFNARKQISDAEFEIHKAGNAAASAASKQNSYNNSMKNGQTIADGLTNKIKGLVAAYLGFQGLSGAIKLSDEVTTNTARLSLLVDGDPDSLKELEDTIFNSAQRVGADFMQTSDVVSKLASNAGDAFKDATGKINLKEVVGFSELLAKQFSIAGVKGGNLSAAMLQLTQAMSSGVLQGDEFKSIMENAPIIGNTVAKYLGVSTDELRKLSSEGKITASVIRNAFAASADDINAQFASMPDTWSTVFTRIKNYAIKAYEPISKKINEIANSPAIKNITNLLAATMVIIANKVVWAMDMVGSVITFIQDNLQLIQPIVYGAAAAFGVWGAAILFAKIQAMATVAWNAIMTASMIAMTFATQGASAGFAALNAIMAMNPVMLVVYAVIALIAVFYLAVAAINHFMGTSISATGLIAGAFMSLYATIYNVIARLYNIFASYAEFLINVFKNPVYSIKALFINLATDFIDSTIAMMSGWDEFATSLANAFLEAVNWVIRGWNKLIDILPDDVSSVLGLSKGVEYTARTSITSDLSDAKASLQKMLGEKPEDYTTLGRLEYKNVKDSYDAGYKWGEDLSNKFDFGNMVNDAFNASEKLTNGLTSDESKEDITKGGKAQSALDKIANNTGKMADSLTASDDELAYLREIGERNAVYKLNTNEIKVSMNNNNTVNSVLDLDDIVSALTKKIKEAASTMAEGNHI